MVWKSYAAAATFAATRRCRIVRQAPAAKKERTMSSSTITNAGQGEPRDVAALLRDIAAAESDIASHGAAALQQVCRSVITGEGPCVAGRKHFSRTLDAEDAALCARILVAAGRDGDPVSQQEADALFAIDAAAGERCDNGRFDDLLAKAVIHYLLAACGHPVPGRDVALSEEVAVTRWARAATPGHDLNAWLAGHLGEVRSPKAAAAIAAVMAGADAHCNEVSIAHVFDLAA